MPKHGTSVGFVFAALLFAWAGARAQDEFNPPQLSISEATSALRRKSKNAERPDNGNLFTWRDHFVSMPVIMPNEPPLDRRDPGDRRLLKPAAEAERVRELLERVMDQISLIPDVQELMRRASTLRRGKIPIHTLLFDSMQIASYSYPSADFPLDQIEIGASLPWATFSNEQGGVIRNSLQRSLVHEICHAADPSNTPQTDLAWMNESATKAIAEFLEDFPEHRAEFQRDGAIAQLPFAAWANSSSVQMKNSLESNIHPGMILRTGGRERVRVETKREEEFSVEFQRLMEFLAV